MTAYIEMEVLWSNVIGLRKVARRANYIDGLHVKANYTALTHYWLTDSTDDTGERVADHFRRTWFIGDGNVPSVRPEIRRVQALHHFLCRTDRSKDI